MIKYWVFILISVFIANAAFAGESSPVRGLRLDPSYFYKIYPNKTAEVISKEVINNAIKSGVNTLFIYAYNSVYGSFYKTNYNGLETEPGFGAQNIFKILTSEAKKNNLKVVAVIPINNFRKIWLDNPSWRALTADGSDYIPKEDYYMLSAWHPKFKTWFGGFVNDLLVQNELIDGVEAVEPFVDLNWKLESDYNKTANAIFKKQFPKSQLGDGQWKKFRADGLTQLISKMNEVVHKHNKKSYLVQTWPIKSDGSLFLSSEIADQIGLDFNAILDLKKENKTDFIVGEFMWQQWAAEYGDKKFSPAWTQAAALDFLEFVNNRAEAIVHIEISSFNGQADTITPNLKQLEESLLSIKDLNVGIDIYDYHQIYEKDAWKTLLSWLNQESNLAAN